MQHSNLYVYGQCIEANINKFLRKTYFAVAFQKCSHKMIKFSLAAQKLAKFLNKYTKSRNILEFVFTYVYQVAAKANGKYKNLEIR